MPWSNTHFAKHEYAQTVQYLKTRQRSVVMTPKLKVLFWTKVGMF